MSWKTLRAYVQKAKMLHNFSLHKIWKKKRYLLMMLLGAKPRNPSQKEYFSLRRETASVLNERRAVKADSRTFNYKCSLHLLHYFLVV
jgi:hypothetical protein